MSNKPPKKDISELENRIGNLESIVNELRESCDLNAISDIKQRLEDVEDLIMVENAGIIELTKIIDSIKNKPETQPSSNISSIEQRMEKIENDINNISNFIQQFQWIKDLNNKLDDVRQGIISSKSQLEETIKEFNERIESFERKKTVVKHDVDFDLILSKIKSLTTDIDSINRKNKEIESKILEFERKIERMKSSEIEIHELDKMIEMLERRMNKIEGLSEKEVRNIESILIKKVGELQKSPFHLDQQINELFNRIISLETKLHAIERHITKKSATILE